MVLFTLQGRIRKDGICCKDSFARMGFSPQRCAHDLVDQVDVKITMNQWVHVVSKSERFIAVHASIVDGVLDSTCKPQGSLPLQNQGLRIRIRQSIPLLNYLQEDSVGGHMF